MSSEDVRQHVDRALDTAVVHNVDLDDVEAILEDALDRVEQVRAMRGER